MSGPPAWHRAHRPGLALLVAAALSVSCNSTAPPQGRESAPRTPTTSAVPVEPSPSAATGAPAAPPLSAASSQPSAGQGPPRAGPATSANPSPASRRDPAGEYPAGPGLVPVGQLAPFVLRPATGTRVVLEVRAQQGAAPTQATLDHVVAVLRAASGKQVVLDGPRALGGGSREWTSSSLRATADAAAVAAQGGGQAVLRLLFLAGSFEGDPGVLGVAVRGDVAAVFSDRVDAASGVLVAPAVVEDAVTVHEVGHLLGLVDLVVDTDREDPEHPGHSRNRDSVMFWQVESGAIQQLVNGGIPRELDADDRAELAAIRRG